MARQDVSLLSAFLSKLFGEGVSSAVPVVRRAVDEGSAGLAKTMLRLAALHPGGSSMDYLQLHNLWLNMGCPALKPNATARNVVLLTDFTADNMLPFLRLFCAARGVAAEIRLPTFDSVEQQALDPGSSLYEGRPDTILLCLSEHWLRRYFGTEAMVGREQVAKACQSLGTIVEAIQSGGEADVLVGNFAGQANPTPGGTVSGQDAVGWRQAVSEVNADLASQALDRVHVVDLATAISLAGGAGALGNLSYLRAKIAFEPAGVVASGREFASAIAHLAGKTHRAVVTDWDNTLWGGEVAEVGALGVVCGHDSPDALGYRMVQLYLRGLRSLGVVLAAASRNDPSTESVFAGNPDMALSLDDFASVQVSFEPKSESIRRIAEDLNFGTEYMVFLDDSLFEIAEALVRHPHLDAIRAGPGPEETLTALARARIANALFVSAADVQRADRLRALKQQRRRRASFSSLADFLKSIDIRLRFSPLDEANQQRILQMFQKTNQFNLTTRRHQASDLARLEALGAKIAGVSYEDSFAPQGIISVVVLLPEQDHVRIESWLMSCRVLNRTVEQAVFEWILCHADGKSVLGEYVPTEKNALVRDLYERFGFRRVGRDEAAGAERWLYTPGDAPPPSASHFARVEDCWKDRT